MTFGHNSVTYDVVLPDRHIIVRTNENADVFASTEQNITLLSDLGLPLPHVLFSDRTKTQYPSAYMILEKIPGRDLRYEIGDMTEAQMTRLAEQIVGFQRTVGNLPAGNGFGFTAIGATGPFSTWQELFEAELESVLNYRENNDLGFWAERVRQIVPRFYPHFEQVSPICFLDDITVKNVIVENGELRGLIDFDVVCYGDPLFMVALTATGIIADVGERELFYVEELCRLWELTPLQRHVVDLYAAMFAIEFLRRDEDSQAQDWGQRTIAAIERWVTGLERERPNM